MKIFIIKLLLLSLLVVATIHIIGSQDNNIYKKKSVDGNIARIIALNTLDSLDILFIGSSRTNNNIVPQIFDSAGYKSFVMATNSAGTFAMEMIWKDYSSHCTQIPKTVVFDMAPDVFSTASDMFEDYPIYRYLNSPLSNEKLFLQFPVSLKDYLQYKYKSFLVGWSQLFNKPDTIKVQQSVASQVARKGFPAVVFYQTMNDSILKSQESWLKSYRRLKFDTQKQNRFFLLVQDMLAQKINVVIHQMPTLRLKYFPDNYMQEYQAACRKLRNMPNVHFLQNEEMASGIFFRDTGHMNSVGAKKYTYWLLEHFGSVVNHMKS